MKKVTIISCLVLIAGLITSCEKETLEPIESAEFNQKIEMQSSKLEEEGLHNNLDYDNDGCPNEDDAYPWSNMNRTVKFDYYTDTEVENYLVDCGTTMSDLIDDLILEMNYEYGCKTMFSEESVLIIIKDQDRVEWEVVHRKFVREIARLTYRWRKDKIITRGERTKLYRAAKNSSVPNCNYNDKV